MSSSQPVHVAGELVGAHRHLCGLFEGPDDECRLLTPFVQEGLERAELVILIIDPAHRAAYTQRFKRKGVDFEALERVGRVELRSWPETFRGEGESDRSASLSRLANALYERKARFPLVRVVIHVDPTAVQHASWEGWAWYESRLNEVLANGSDPLVCSYDVSTWSGAAVTHALRAHPVIIFDGSLRANSFFVSAEESLLRFREHAVQQRAIEVATAAETQSGLLAGANGGVDPREQALAVFGHDLRAPLAAIVMGASSLARRTELSGGFAAIARRILVSAKRIDGIIDDLLDFATAQRGGGGGVDLRPEWTDVHELCARIVDEVKTAHPGRDVHLSIDDDASGDWDPHRLEQVVSNLASNALQYSPEDTPVTVESHGGDAFWTFSIHNLGPPIAPEFLPHVFDPFSRPRHTLHGTGEGAHLGLGLFIVREIVNAHGGKIEVISEPAVGTRFVVRLPRRAPPR